jgi:predicted DNA-binding protein
METSMRRFNHSIAVRLPNELHEVLQKAAAREYTKPSEYLRRVTVKALQSDGYLPLLANTVESEKA